MSQTFTCLSCRVVFVDSEIHRQHYKTEWHQCNLRRKHVNLPPVTAEDFQLRIEKLREKEENESKKTSMYCKACRKTFSCSKAFDNHLNSKRHKDALNNYAGSEENIAVTLINPKREVDRSIQKGPDEVNESDIEEIDSDEWEDEEDEEGLEISENNPILKNNCLFCSHHSNSMTKNLNHMSIEHSFFIPDVDYVIDLRNLLLYLGEKVCKLFMCLWCNTSGRGFYSMEAAQAHMRDKGHCKVLHEGHTLVEFEPFYNYSTSYPDYVEGMDIDEEVTLPDLDTGDYELTLPSGATIGHRALAIYYNQHYSGKGKVVVKQNKLNKVLSTYRALGWKETDRAVAVKKAKDIRYMKAVQSKMAMRLGVKSNKLQTHFRAQVMF